MATIKFMKVKGTWREVADAARTTIRQDEGTKEPSQNLQLVLNTSNKKTYFET